MTKDEALKLALEALEFMNHVDSIFEGEFNFQINAIKEALAQPEQEPVACVEYIPCCTDQTFPKCKAAIKPELVCVCGAVWEGQELIYTTPQRKPLSEEEIGAILEDVNAYGTRLYTFARAIEAAHGIKEKNT